MKKDVMIFIKGSQEVDGEKDTIELMTKGRYYKRRDVLYLAYEEMDEEETYEITGTTESNAMENKISNESPVGAALLKHKVGDTVKVVAPDGEYKLKIMSIA